MDAANVVSFVLCLELMVVCVGVLSPFPGTLKSLSLLIV